MCLQDARAFGLCGEIPPQSVRWRHHRPAADHFRQDLCRLRGAAGRDGRRGRSRSPTCGVSAQGGCLEPRKQPRACPAACCARNGPTSRSATGKACCGRRPISPHPVAALQYPSCGSTWAMPPQRGGIAGRMACCPRPKMSSSSRYHTNGHAWYLQAPRMMKENGGARCAVVRGRSFFWALTPHANVIQAADSYPELWPLSTHSKKASSGVLAKAFGGLTTTCAPRCITRSTEEPYPCASFMGSGVYCLSSPIFHSKTQGRQRRPRYDRRKSLWDDRRKSPWDPSPP